MIKTAYDVYENEPTPSGSDVKYTYGYVKKTIDDLDDKGKKVGLHEEIVFESIGEESISEFINSFEDTTDIKKIFQRYQMGDVSVLSKRVGEFVADLNATDGDLAQIARDTVATKLNGAEIIKTIVVPRKLVNFVVKK